jgi:hypothetical protein
MKIIKTFSIGDRVPDDAQMIGQQHFVDFKLKERISEFYFLIPQKRKPSPKRP